MALHDGQVRQLNAQFGGALDAAGFAYVLDVAYDHLTAAGHDPAVHDERVFQHGRKLVADLVAVAGKVIIDANEEDCSGRYGERSGELLGRLSSLRRWRILGLSLGWVLAWPVMRIGWLIGVLRGIGRLCLGILRWLLLVGLLPLLGVLLVLLRVGPCTEAQCQGCRPSRAPKSSKSLQNCWVVRHYLGLPRPRIPANPPDLSRPARLDGIPSTPGFASSFRCTQGSNPAAAFKLREEIPRYRRSCAVRTHPNTPRPSSGVQQFPAPAHRPWKA